MRLKDCATLNPVCKSEAIVGDVSFVPMESLRCDKIDSQRMPIDEVRGKYTPFANGDLLVARVTPCFERGNIAVASGLLNGLGFGSSEIFVLRANEKALARYLFYLTLTAKFQDGACATMCGVGGLKRISPEFMRTYELDLPLIVDQRRIVEYLDSRCAAIDRKVALLEQKRTAYAKLKRAVINETVSRGLDKNAELKDSGVDWIGKMPEGWAIMRIKDVACSVGSGGTPAAGNALFYADANGYNWVSISDMSNVEYVTKTEKLLTQAGVEDKQLTVFPPGTVLYSMYATIGRVSELAIPSTINQAILAITFSPKYCKGFIKYALKAFEPWAIAHTSESTQKNLNAEKVRRFFIAVPNAEEQRIIANYLDAKCARIDKVLVLVAKKIELYKKLKRSLIDEVVTGRRKVA